MSVAGILASSLFSNAGSMIAQKANNLASALGSDLTSGSLSGAKSDYAALQKKLMASTSSTGSSSLPSSFTQLGQDLKSGNLSAARTDFNNMQTAISHNKASLSSSGLQSGDSAATSPNLMAAIQAYSALQNNPMDATLGSALSARSGGFSVTA